MPRWGAFNYLATLSKEALKEHYLPFASITGLAEESQVVSS